MFVYGPISQAVLRYYSISRDRGELAAYFSVLDRIYLRSAAALALVALAAAGFALAALDSEWAGVAGAAILLGIGAGSEGYLISVLSALRRRIAVAAYQAVDAILKPLLALGLFVVAGPNARAALGGFFVATVLVNGVQWLHARHARPRNGPHAGEPIALRGQILAYVLSFAAFSAFGAINSYADRWIVLAMDGERDLGIYAAMSQIANTPFIVGVGLLTQLVLPVLFDRAGAAGSQPQLEQADRLLRACVGASVAWMAAIVAAGWLLSEPLMLLLSSAQFAGRSELLWLIMLSSAVFQLGQLLALKGLVYQRPRVYFLPKALQAATLVAFGLVWTRPYGLAGLVAALNLSSALYVLAVLFANRALRANRP